MYWEIELKFVPVPTLHRDGRGEDGTIMYHFPYRLVYPSIRIHNTTSTSTHCMSAETQLSWQRLRHTQSPSLGGGSSSNHVLSLSHDRKLMFPHLLKGFPCTQ